MLRERLNRGVLSRVFGSLDSHFRRGLSTYAVLTDFRSL